MNPGMSANYVSSEGLRRSGYRPVEVLLISRIHNVLAHGPCADFDILGDIPQTAGYTFSASIASVTSACVYECRPVFGRAVDTVARAAM